jgi:hypothetical protein
MTHPGAGSLTGTGLRVDDGDAATILLATSRHY